MPRHILLSALVCLVGCRAEGAAYVFLGELCADYAEDVCAARVHCCDDASSTCKKDVAAECTVTRQAIEARDGLVYDASHATDVRSSLVVSLDSCADPFLLARFFSGALDDGAACSEDLDCSSGACTRDSDSDATGICTAATSLLCPAP